MLRVNCLTASVGSRFYSQHESELTAKDDTLGHDAGINEMTAWFIIKERCWKRS
jgi:hypothetical protein